MKKLMICSILFAFVTPISAIAGDANAVAEACITTSKEWGVTDDRTELCACIGDAAAGDAGLVAEFLEFGSKYSSDEEAYEGASTAAKSVMDQCAPV